MSSAFTPTASAMLGASHPMNKQIISCLSLIVFSTACGHTSGPETGSAASSQVPAAATKASRTEKRDPCSLLTKEEISAALGTEMRTAHSDDGMHCMYSGLMPGTGASVTYASGADNVKMLFTESKRLIKEAGNKGFQEITGIGDEAYSSGGNNLNVRKGDAYFAIALGTLAALSEPQGRDQIYAELLEKEKSLAMKVLARL